MDNKHYIGSIVIDVYEVEGDYNAEVDMSFDSDGIHPLYIMQVLQDVLQEFTAQMINNALAGDDDEDP